MDDRYFGLLEQLVDGTLDPRELSHRDHVGLATASLRRHGFFTALGLIAEGLEAAAHRAGCPEKFNATVTLASMSLLAEQLAHFGDGPIDAFIDQYSDSVARASLLNLYRSRSLTTPLARQVGLLPGLAASSTDQMRVTEASRNEAPSGRSTHKFGASAPSAPLPQTGEAARFGAAMANSEDTSDIGDSPWTGTTQPPYGGGCLCGDVRFRALRRPDRVGICHCHDCRKHHGALFHASAIFPAESVTVVGVTHHYRERHFCPRCGSSVFSRSGDEIELHLGSLDSCHGLVPTYELWTLRRERWLPEFPGMTRYERDRQVDGHMEAQ